MLVHLHRQCMYQILSVANYSWHPLNLLIRYQDTICLAVLRLKTVFCSHASASLRTLHTLMPEVIFNVNLMHFILPAVD
jgi:hypothetical protein